MVQKTDGLFIVQYHIKKGCNVLYILAFKNGVFVRAVSYDSENTGSTKDDMKQDFNDDSLTFLEMTQQEFEDWETEQQSDILTPPSLEERLRMTEETLLFFMDMQTGGL